MHVYPCQLYAFSICSLKDLSIIHALALWGCLQTYLGTPSSLGLSKDAVMLRSAIAVGRLWLLGLFKLHECDVMVLKQENRSQCLGLMGDLVMSA